LPILLIILEYLNRMLLGFKGPPDRHF